MTVVERVPIVKTIEVRRSASDAFRLFTEHMSDWWPLDSHARALGEAGEPPVTVTVEPRAGGRVFETLRDGSTLDWGEVLAYRPGELFAMRWSLGRPPAESSEVAVRFEALSGDRCRVILRHDHWERVLVDAKALHSGYVTGWITVFEEGFGGFAGGAC